MVTPIGESQADPLTISILQTHVGIVIYPSEYYLIIQMETFAKMIKVVVHFNEPDVFDIKHGKGSSGFGFFD